MSNYHSNLAVKIEAGQILNPDSFPAPNELVCIQVPKVFDQVSLRDCVTRDIVLMPGPDVCRPAFTFEGAHNFDIVEVRVVSKTASLTKPGFKKLKLLVRIKYNIYYSDGVNRLSHSDEAAFNLTVNDIYCPNCSTQIGVTRYPKDDFCIPAGTMDADGLFLKVEALAEAFDAELCPCTGALMLDIGAFFVVKCECSVQLLIPAYGYCPVPLEQINPAHQNSTTFNDWTKTPFPSHFFPRQKWNPLDKK